MDPDLEKPEDQVAVEQTEAGEASAETEAELTAALDEFFAVYQHDFENPQSVELPAELLRLVASGDDGKERAGPLDSVDGRIRVRFQAKEARWGDQRQYRTRTVGLELSGLLKPEAVNEILDLDLESEEREIVWRESDVWLTVTDRPETPSAEASIEFHRGFTTLTEDPLYGKEGDPVAAAAVNWSEVSPVAITNADEAPVVTQEAITALLGRLTRGPERLVYPASERAVVEEERGRLRGELGAQYQKLRERYGREYNGSLLRWTLPLEGIPFFINGSYRTISAEGGRLAMHLGFRSERKVLDVGTYDGVELATSLVLPPEEADQALPVLGPGQPARSAYLLTQREMRMGFMKDQHGRTIGTVFDPGFTTLHEHVDEPSSAHTNIDTAPTIDEKTLLALLQKANELFEEDDRRRGVPERD